jgi:hypothetical protein
MGKGFRYKTQGRKALNGADRAQIRSLTRKISKSAPAYIEYHTIIDGDIWKISTYHAIDNKRLDLSVSRSRLHTGDIKDKAFISRSGLPCSPFTDKRLKDQGWVKWEDLIQRFPEALEQLAQEFSSNPKRVFDAWRIERIDEIDGVSIELVEYRRRGAGDMVSYKRIIHERELFGLEDSEYKRLAEFLPDLQDRARKANVQSGDKKASSVDTDSNEIMNRKLIHSIATET